jgi:hypothetical protein
VSRLCWLLPLLLLWGCRKDAGLERLQELKGEYRALVEAGVPPQDPRFDALAQQLRAIPAASQAAPEAEMLARRIEATRHLPVRPLATPHAAEETQELARTCAALARALGTATIEERPKVAEALARCQRELEEARAHGHPPGEHPHDHPR